MSRKILCTDCDLSLQELAHRHNELFESVQGQALYDMLCDDCGTVIGKN